MDNYIIQQPEPWSMFPEIQQRFDSVMIPDNYYSTGGYRSEYQNSYMKWLSKLSEHSEYIYELSEDRPHYILPHEHVLKFVSISQPITFCSEENPRLRQFVR